MEKKKRHSLTRRLFLTAVGYMALALNKMEGKSTQPPKTVKKGRIKIVS